jgi:uncharacterized membrane protein YraQ (UPF0718 family)
MIDRIARKIGGAWYFLGAVIILYLLLLLFLPAVFFRSLDFFIKIMLQILPIFVLVFVLMTLSNLFVNRRTVSEYLRKPGIKKWLFVIVAGILSTGPIYVWYPLLAEFKEKGVGYGYMATFLYNRAIKIPLLPVAVLYFGIKYVVVLTALMVLFSVIQGVLIDRLVPVEH